MEWEIFAQYGRKGLPEVFQRRTMTILVLGKILNNFNLLYVFMGFLMAKTENDHGGTKFASN